MPMSEKLPPGVRYLHSKSLTMQTKVRKKLSTIDTKAHAQPPFLKFFGRYNIPVQTKPFKREKYVYIGDIFLVVRAFSFSISVDFSDPLTPYYYNLLLIENKLTF
jgi:hypothetical protein